MSASRLKSVIIVGMLLVAASSGTILNTSAQSSSEPLTQPTLASLPAARLSGADVQRRDTSMFPAILNSRTVVVQGYRDEDGNCKHGFAFTSPKNDTTPQEARLIAMDLDDCRFEVEYGNPSSVPKHPVGGSSATSEAETYESTGEFTSLSSGIAQATFETHWYDQVGFGLNLVRNAVAVSHTNGSITHTECKDYRWWQSNTGWTQLYNYLDCDDTAVYGESSTTAVFGNDPFCGGTWVNYNGNTVYATAYGMSGYFDSTYASGCLSGTFYYNTFFWPNSYF